MRRALIIAMLILLAIALTGATSAVSAMATLPPTTLTAQTSGTLVDASGHTAAYVNGRFAISGVLQGVPGGPLKGKPVFLEASTDNANWARVSANKLTDSSGGYSFTGYISQTGTYYLRATFAGDTTYAGVSSPSIAITIYPALHAAIVNTWLGWWSMYGYDEAHYWHDMTSSTGPITYVTEDTWYYSLAAGNQLVHTHGEATWPVGGPKWQGNFDTLPGEKIIVVVTVYDSAGHSSTATTTLIPPPY